MSAVAAVRSQVRFTDLLRSEWTKLRSLPSVWWTLLAMVVLSTTVTLLVTSGDEATYSGLSPEDKLAWDPTALSLNSFFLAQLCVSVLGILVVTSEYATGTIRTSLSAMPRRGSVAGGKDLGLRGRRPGGRTADVVRHLPRRTGDARPARRYADSGAERSRSPRGGRPAPASTWPRSACWRWPSGR